MEGDPISSLCTPALVVDIDKVRKNSERMTDRYKKLGVQLRPHMKTHKTIECADIMTSGSRRCIVVSTLAEASFYADHGFEDILYAYSVPFDKVERCAALSERLDLFQVLLDHPDALEQLKKWPLRDGDCGMSGVLHSLPEALNLAQDIHAAEGVELTGIYAHCGNTYYCKGIEQIQHIGSTPSCSHPVQDMAQLSEVHPGNYVFYDVQQSGIGSCSLEDVAVRVLTRVIGHCPHRNQLLIDCGWTGLSLDGAGKLPSGYAVVEGHPDLKLLSMTQEHGRVEPISGKLDYSKYPLGTMLKLIPYHSCATAAMHPTYYVHSKDRLVGKWTPTPMSELEVKFIGDKDVLEHIVDKQENGTQPGAGAVQKMVTFKSPAGRLVKGQNGAENGDENGRMNQHYTQALAAEDDDDVSRVAGSSIFTFQKSRRGHSMAQTASELARTPGKSVTFNTAPMEPSTPTRTGRHTKGEARTPQRNKKSQFVSTTPHRLRKRMTTPSLRSDSDSELSPSDSGEELEEDDKMDNEQNKGLSAALYKTPAKKSKNAPEPANQPSMVEEYFEAHGSSKVLTSDRTLEKLNTPKLDRETLIRLLEGKPSCYAKEILELHNKYRQHFSKWMLQLQLGFNVLVYGLGSKKSLLEDFRISQLSQELHVVINGFFPSITLKSILNALTSEVLEHHGSFRTPTDQIQFISQTLKDSQDLQVYLIIHNIDGPMLRGEKTQSALAQLASLPNLHLVASIDHINGPLVWDQFKQSQFNWLWWECVTFQHYAEETSYENSLLVQQTGALALSSLTHVLRSLTPNARGIFKLLVKFQLENKDNPSYTGLSFQDFYQRCREAFLVNSDLTLRTQLTEFRDHKLIRTRKGADGVEYLIVPVEANTLVDFLENEQAD
ncbi:hypothetical protein WMY93_000828 [Mugilogobius chulae]|uniref:Origin recognition complex subunit 2 n=1 Tax=Mugilogobius chulae TaxID=88201 RepID=A0AAW0QB62_9GOBI